MKSLLLMTKFMLVSLVMLVSFSCDGEDGAIGPQGPAGQNGTDGINGQDGNANVQTYTFDTSAENGSTWNVDASQLTQDVLDNDVVLTYLRRATTYYYVPGTSFNDEVKVPLFLSTVQLLFYNRSSGAPVTPAVGTYDLLKLVIIESSGTTAGRGVGSKESIYQELAGAGVDISNYEQVMEYYNLEH